MMDSHLKGIISSFETKIGELNREREQAFGTYKRLKVTVLGQQGLLIRRENLSKLNLLATNDFDAWLNGEVVPEEIFKKILKEHGLSYDEQSEYIWLPDETEYETIYESGSLYMDSPLPIYLIVSKALKAPEKNRQLIIGAIVEFGEQLLRLMEKYKVDIEYFV